MGNEGADDNGADGEPDPSTDRGTYS